MNVFISWSTDKSRELAEVISNWLPFVIQSVSPFFSPDAITKGSRWNSEVSKALNDCKFGILCIVDDNIDAPWIMFEAGALSKQIDKSKVVPILFNIKPTDLKGPLTQFQCAIFNKNEINKVVKSINNELSPEFRLKDDVLDSTFEVWWPKLEDKINNILSISNKQIVRTDRELIEEILIAVRDRNNDIAEKEDNNEYITNLYALYYKLVIDVIDYKHIMAYYDLLQDITDCFVELLKKFQISNLVNDVNILAAKMRRTYEKKAY